MSETLPVSVVIPAYGRPHLLRQALDSVFAQTRAPSEVLVVDDGSEPPLEHVVSEYQARYVRRPNGGAGAARNTGFRAASQPWIAFLDSDDRWKPHKLERQFAACEQCSDADAVICDFLVTRDGAEWTTTALEVHSSYQTIPRQALSGGAVRLRQPDAARALCVANYLQPSTMLVRRSLLERIGGFDERLRYCEDYDFGLRLFHLATPIAVDEPLVLYRSHDNGLSAREIEMRRGDLSVDELIHAAPERYPLGACEVFAAKRPRKLIELAKGELLSGDYKAARATLRKSLAARPTPFAAAALAFACIAPVWPQRLRRTALAIWTRRPWNVSPRWRRAQH
ncbi:MAG: glycosyltransferase family 2 protein [Candidatus Eremiobacteraeota bacterium]|nr:glycosyltransferase family 2 protein [Candidatus Eremiobacteraeota bacterium]